MGVAPRSKWPNWLRGLWQGLSCVVRFVVGCVETVVDWMDSQVFRGIRVLATLGLIWFFIRRINVQSSGIGLTTTEFHSYGRAALIALLLGACLSVLWSSTLCDGLTGVLLSFVDDVDDRPLKEDPMDKLDRLVKAGRIKRARRLCRRMLRKRQGSRMMLKTLLIHLEDRLKGKPAFGSHGERIRGGK